MNTGDLESRVTALEGQVRDLTGRVRQDFVDLREHVDHGFTEMRGKFDVAAAGQLQIVDLLHTIITDKGPNGPTE